MHFTETSIPGVWFVECETFVDERGGFTPTWVRDEFAARGLDTGIALGGLATNRRRGTIRGLHLQAAPFAQSKTVRVVRGAIFDVAVDLRPESPTFRRWVGTELTADNHRLLYVPKGFAHGYQTLTDDAAVLYFVSAAHSPAHERGVRWDDPAIGVDWPLGAPSIINDRDANFPDLLTSMAREPDRGQPA